MATLDTLPPQRRAIIELLLRQRQGYDDVASTLDMPPARVRELAREALSSLAPSSARRVDDEWRDQVADYVLGQQTGPESKATRGHLRRSEPARTWVSSLVDSLDPLYGDGQRPEIPEVEGARGQAAERPRRSGGRGSAAGAAGAGAAGAGAPPAASASPRDSAATEADEAAASASDRERAARARPGLAEPAREGSRDHTEELSPEARAVVRRRRIVAGAIIAAVLVLTLAVVLIGGGGDDEEGGRAADRPAPNERQQGQEARLVGQAELRAVGGSDAQGVAVIAERSGEFQLLVQARGLEPSGRDAAYEVWLYNSPSDAVSLGGQVTDNDGNLQGAGPLPPNFRNYRFVDVSRERIDRDADHSGDSVLRIPMRDLLRAPAPGGQGGGAGGGTP